jgi:translation initiation factor IF-3
MNELIRAPQVHVIASDGEKLGVLRLEDALARARAEELDLVEVAPTATPPVCRIMDYNKMQYEKQRKMKEAKKHQRHVEVKEVKLRPYIDEHDYGVKLNHLRGFLLDGNKCKVTLQYRAREMRRSDVGNELIQKMLVDVKDIAAVEGNPPTRGKMVVVFLSPTKEVVAEAERKFKEELQQRREEHERRLQEKHVKVSDNQEAVAPQPTAPSNTEIA